jgi:hypothetical protein
VRGASCQIDLDQLGEPVWKDEVDRWYQLDAFSKVACQGISLWNLNLDQRKNISGILYLFSHGSNQADFDFSRQLVSSPSKFVYTLPNISAMLVQQLLKISVTTFCIDLGIKINLVDPTSLSKIKNILNPVMLHKGHHLIFHIQKINASMDDQKYFFQSVLLESADLQIGKMT